MKLGREPGKSKKMQELMDKDGSTGKAREKEF